MKFFYILLTSLILSFSMGCGAHASHDLGIPVSKSESFYFHMKEAALNAGYRTSVSEKGDLHIYVPEGQLIYKPNMSGDGLAVTLYTNSADNDAVEEKWLNTLEDIHEELLAAAKVMAKKNQAW